MLIQKKKKIIKKVSRWRQFGDNINLNSAFYVKYCIIF